MAGFRLRQRRLRQTAEPAPKGGGRGERGFVLIAAIWLLILAGSITAILMLRSLAASTAATDRSVEVERRLALESAIETVLADRLFNSARSRWWLVPSEGSILIRGMEVRLRMTSESGRIDLNYADPTLIDSALRGMGIDAGARRIMLNRILALRTLNNSIRSVSEHDAIIAEIQPTSAVCLSDQFTFVSGLSQPQTDQMSETLSLALGLPAARTEKGASSPVEGSTALRIEARAGMGSPLTSIVRLTGLPGRPYEVSVWMAEKACPGLG